MINKKVLGLSLILIVFFAICVFAEHTGNFVAVLSGANTATGSGEKSYSFVGQPVVFNTVESTDYVSKSAFASFIYITLYLQSIT